MPLLTFWLPEFSGDDYSMQTEIINHPQNTFHVKSNPVQIRKDAQFNLHGCLTWSLKIKSEVIIFFPLFSHVSTFLNFMLHSCWTRANFYQYSQFLKKRSGQICQRIFAPTWNYFYRYRFDLICFHILWNHFANVQPETHSTPRESQRLICSPWETNTTVGDVKITRQHGSYDTYCKPVLKGVVLDLLYFPGIKKYVLFPEKCPNALFITNLS